MTENKDKTEITGGENLITRKEALLKAGKYAAFTAASMMTILEPVSGQGRPPKKSPKPPRESTTKKAVKPTRTDPPPRY
jgi:hypothetical protein